MTQKERRQQVQAALAACASEPVKAGALRLLDALGYRSEKTLDLVPNAAAEFLAVFRGDRPWNDARGRTAEWRSVDVLLQITDDEVRAAGQTMLAFDSTAQFDGKRYESFVFIAIDLQAQQYSRTALAEITREVNKLFAMPVLVLFRHGPTVSLSVIDRRLSKTDAARDVLEKVTLIKDIRCANPHRAHIDILAELSLPELREKEKVTSFIGLHGAWRKTLDIEPMTRAFIRDYRAMFGAFEAEVRKSIPDERDAHLFAQTLLNRFMFCWFLQKKGWLDGKDDYLRMLWQSAEDHAHTGGKGPRYPNFYRDYLWLLFFCALNTPTGQRPGDPDWSRLESVLERVPFLNGGLFAPHPTLDAREAVRLPNSAFVPVFALFEGYHFTVAESTPLDVEVAVDPEMLGKVFEELVTERQEKGSYFTPRSIVSFMCREALKGYLGGCAELVDNRNTDGITVPEARRLLKQLEGVRVVDPACGSGAYLLGMLHELHDLTRVLDTRAAPPTPRDDYQRKLAIICGNLYGVDLDEFAVNIARLRLWLSLAVEYEGDDPQPLPNLDFKIERGDSLLAPDPSGGKTPDMFRRQRIEEFEQAKADYTVTSDGARKADIMSRITALRTLIAAWAHPFSDVRGFDWSVEFAEVYASGGFDIVLANPPYGEGAVTDDLRDTFFGRRSGQSKDIYAAFLARGVQLLKPGGMLSYITSNTWRTLRTHRPLREYLRQNTAVLHFIDVPEWVFGAVVRTCILTARKGVAPPGHRLVAADLAALLQGDWSALDANLLAIASRGPDLQTLTFARYTYEQNQINGDGNKAFFIARPSLQRFFTDPRYPRLGEGPDALAKIAQGLATADNEYYIRVAGAPKGKYRSVDSSLVLTEEQLREFAARSPEDRLRGIDPSDFGGRHFVPYDKGADSDLKAGGWLPCFHVPTEYYLDWSCEAVHRLKTATIADCKRRRGEAPKPDDQTKRAAVIRNPDLYFQPGITFSRTGRYAPTFRLATGSAFDSKSCFVACAPDRVMPLLALLNSRAIFALGKSFLNNGWGLETDDVKGLRIVLEGAEAGTLAGLANSIVEKQADDPRYPFWLNEGIQIDAVVAGLYGLTADEVRDIDLWFCRYERGRLAQSRGEIERVRERYGDYLAWCEQIMSKPSGYWASHPLLALIARGESAALEFKETLEAGGTSPEQRKGVLQSALKTVCAFLNTNGGALLIGVADDGSIKGLEPDLALLGNRRDNDGFEQKLRNLLQARFSPTPLGLVDVQFETLPEGTVCQVTVSRADQVIHLDNAVYIRDGNTTRRLEGPDLTAWVQRRAA